MPIKEEYTHCSSKKRTHNLPCPKPSFAPHGEAAQNHTAAPAVAVCRWPNHAGVLRHFISSSSPSLHWRSCCIYGANNTKEKAFIYGYSYGLGLFGIGVSWLHISINLFGGVSLIGAYGITFLLIAYLSLFPALVGYLSRLYDIRSEGYYYLLTVPSLWTLGECLRARLFTGFPWLSLGYTQTDSALAGYAPLAGVFAVSFFIVLLSGLLLLLLLGST